MDKYPPSAYLNLGLRRLVAALWVLNNWISQRSSIDLNFGRYICTKGKNICWNAFLSWRARQILVKEADIEFISSQSRDEFTPDIKMTDIKLHDIRMSK